ncbi:hypothetical protein C7974DRAFT_165776 [Boeremia exigua]|uniref:uncharacterized protein n=1 Tax=Boeremia exigua TaxID=749465 RepID=UPI001E8D7811|nr:uncharacterized protein C7974DRAFT_165776 [Boeremia exigua]KAH6633147.1 hypothetical protein C7974DRAFT_165776 [Boeremia exigua]
MALNPIACDNCRSKKCRCDRRVPSCSQCRASSLICRYQEGGKRGLPIAYINNLERRLRDTESALYATMLAFDERDSIQASNFGLLKTPRELSKTERQDDWRRLPLQTPDQLAMWFQEKKLQAVAPQAELPSISFPAVPALQPTDLRAEEDPRMALPIPHTPGSESMHSPAYPESASSNVSKGVAEQLRGIEPPQAPNTSGLPLKSTSWHNYF